MHPVRDPVPASGQAAGDITADGGGTPRDKELLELMPRLLHIADVHLGARHHDLGAAAAKQRERQFEAFQRGIELAIAERVDAVLIAGDLFDSNHQPRRSVERAAAELRRLADAGVRSILIPGTHDCYEPGSIYRVFDLSVLAGQAPGSTSVVVLTPDRPVVVYPSLDLAIHGAVFGTKRAPTSPFARISVRSAPARWHVALVHGSLRIPGRVEDDDVIFDQEEIAASGLHYLALGHWHSFQSGRAGETVWAYAGAPEPVAVDQDGAGQVLLVTLEEQRPGGVRLERRAVGRTRFRKLDFDAAELGSQAELLRRVRPLADPDLVLDIRLVGVEPDAFDLDEDEVGAQLEPLFFKHRIRHLSVPAPLEGPLPSRETIPGAFIRELEDRIAAAGSAGEHGRANELRESLRVGRLLLDDPSRVTLV